MSFSDLHVVSNLWVFCETHKKDILNVTVFVHAMQVNNIFDPIDFFSFFFGAYPLLYAQMS